MENLILRQHSWRSAARNLWATQVLQLLLLIIAFGFLAHNAQAQSPTMDEQNHIARGCALLRTGDPRLSVEHPPLINLLEALPLGRGVTLPLDDVSWRRGDWYRFADLFLWQANASPDRIVFLARMPIVALTLLLGALAGRWGQEIGGRYAGVLALGFILLDPNLLAHGSLATTDLGVTFATLLASYVLWRTEAKPCLLRLGINGLAIGLLLASKMSAWVVWGGLGVAFLWQVWGNDRWRSEGGWQAVTRSVVLRGFLYLGITVLALLVVWAVYAFQLASSTDHGPLIPMGTYWRGIGQIFRQVQGGRPSYLLGKTRLGGWRLYFPIAFLVKTPLASLLLITCAVGLSRVVTRQSVGAFLLLPVLVYWGAALASDLNIGYRHLLPTLPLLYVWGAQQLSLVDGSRWRRIGLGLLLWLAAETVWIAPDFLPYFNPIGGGPEHGWRVLADSNIDWGQDLKRLSVYLRTHAHGERVKLSWFGSSYPERYGIEDYEPLPGLPHHFDLWFQPPTFNEAQPEPGLYVISVSNLVELPLVDKHFFAYFRDREPDARIGYSVYIYRVGEN